MGPEERGPDHDARPRYQRLFVRVLVVQVITLILLGWLQSTFGP